MCGLLRGSSAMTSICSTLLYVFRLSNVESIDSSILSICMAYMFAPQSVYHWLDASIINQSSLSQVFYLWWGEVGDRGINFNAWVSQCLRLLSSHQYSCVIVCFNQLQPMSNKSIEFVSISILLYSLWVLVWQKICLFELKQWCWNLKLGTVYQWLYFLVCSNNSML